MNLKEKIHLILESEQSAYQDNGRRSGGFGTFNVRIQSVPGNGATSQGSVKKYLFEEPDKDFIKSENASLLFEVFSSLGEEEKKQFVRILIKTVDKDSSYRDVAYLSTFVLVKLGLIKQVAKATVTKLQEKGSIPYTDLLHMLKLLIAREYNYFTEDEYVLLMKTFKDDVDADFALNPTLREGCKKIISSNAKERDNPEIIEDRHNLISFFQVHHEAWNMHNLIKHVEDLFENKQFGDTTYATCVDRVRAMVSELTKKVAIEKSNQGSKPISASWDDKQYREYLLQQKHISKDVRDFLQSFYSMCSNKGAHLPHHDRDTARFIKNTGYEILIMLRGLLR